MMGVATRRRNAGRRWSLAALGSVSLAVAPLVCTGVTYTGTVDMLEIWKSGNVAFSLLPAVTGYCNGQFIVNASALGSKNLVATLIAAKTAGKPVRVYSTADTTGCVAADGYGGTYLEPAYVYLLD